MPETLSGKPLEGFSFLGKAVFLLILQIVDLKSNKGKAIKRKKKNTTKYKINAFTLKF